MVPLDPAISLQAGKTGVAPVNPLDLVQHFAETQNLLNNNTQFQRNLSAQKLLGQMATESVDPATGQLNYDSLLTKAFSNPLTASAAPQTMTAIRQGQLAQFQMGGVQQEQAVKALGQVHAALASASSPELLMPSLHGILATMPKYTQDALAPVIGDLTRTLLAPRSDGKPLDLDTYAQRRASLAALAGMNGDQRQMAFGIPGTQNIGGAIVPTMQNAATGDLARPQGSLPVGMSPSDAATPVQYGMTPEGQPGAGSPMTVLKGQLAGSGMPGPMATPPGNPLAGRQPPGVPSGVGPAAEANIHAATDQWHNYTGDLSRTVNTDIPRLLQTLDVGAAAGQVAQLGGGAGVREWAGQKLQALEHAGIKLPGFLSPDKIANSSLSDTQIVQATQFLEGIQQLTLAAAGQGRTMRPEVDAAMSVLGDISKDPRAIEHMQDYLRGVSKTFIQQIQDAADYQKGLPAGKVPDVADFTSQEIPRMEGRGQLNTKSVVGTFKRPEGEGGAKAPAAPDATRVINGKTYYKFGQNWYDNATGK